MKNHSKQTNEYLVLKPTEEKVVRFLKSQKDKVSISEISLGVGLARTSIYSATESLLKKRIIAKNRFQYFLVSGDLTQSDKYNTKRKIENLLQEMLQLKKGEIIYSIESDEEIEYLIKENEGLPRWQTAIANKGVVLKGIGSRKALSLFRNMQNKGLESKIKSRSGSARFMAESLAGPCVLVSFHNSIILFSRKNSYLYRIDDISIARFMQSIIEALYLNLEYKPLFVE